MKPATLEERVRRAVLGHVMRGEPFRAADLAAGLPGAGLPEIARILAGLEQEGLLRPFGYRRRLTKDLRPGFAISVVEYAPRAEDRPSRKPTRRPEQRPYGYLPIGGREAQKLLRQTSSIRTQIHRAGRDLFRVGELLAAVERLIGRPAFASYVKKELQMSVDTARRLVRVARAFDRHPEVDALSVLRPSVLYALSAPSFPVELREAILQSGGVTIDGRLRPLAELQVADLRLTLARHRDRKRAEAELMRAIAHTSNPSLRAELEARLAEVTRRSLADVDSEAARSALGQALADVANLAHKISDDPAPWTLPEALRTDGIEALRRLLHRLEEVEK